jgi:dGTPase
MKRAQAMSKSSNAFLAALGARFVRKESASLESQVVDWADAIAYLHADMEDAINMGIVNPSDLAKESPKFAKFWAQAMIKNIFLDEKDPRIVHDTIRNMMSHSIRDLIETSQQAILASGVKTLDDVRKQPSLIQFSPQEEREHLNLKRMSKKIIYDHPEVEKQRAGQEEQIRTLFLAYKNNPSLMPVYHDEKPLGRQICDTIASLTDRGVVRELKRIEAFVVEQPRKTGRKEKP